MSSPADARDAALGGVLMCPPTAFEVRDEKNVFMRDQQGRVDAELARRQWDALRDAYREEGLTVHLLDPLPDAEDMVFTANPCAVLPQRDGAPLAILSRMRHASRQPEVAAHAAWLASRGVRAWELPAQAGHFEGHGDLVLMPEGRGALLGLGGRTEAGVLPHLRALAGIPLHPLPLLGDTFYHLDTALAVLDARTVLVHPPAFRASALGTLGQLFERVLEVDAAEAAEHLACNVHALATGRVLIPAQATRTCAQLERAGFSPRPIDVSEFHRSGGSVFCMKLDLPASIC